MAIMNDLERRKQGDRRTALLGLAADRHAAAGACPTSAEMAECMENACSVEKKEDLFRHISVCETCYREWLTMQQVLRPIERKKKKIYGIFARSRIAVFGTLLAAAASVVVFLNIRQPVLEMKPAAIPTQSLLRESRPLPETGKMKTESAAPGESREVGAISAKPAELSAPVRKRLESGDAEKAVGRSTPSTQAPDAPIANDAKRAEALDAAKERSQTAGGVAEPLKKAQSPALSFTEWRDRVAESCREGRNTGERWRELERQGREVRNRQEGMSRQEREMLEQLLNLMSGADAAQYGARCRGILELIERNSGGGAGRSPVR